MRGLLLLALLLRLCFSGASAADWYQVETIVFAYTEPRYAGGERFDLAVDPIAVDGAFDLMADLPLADEPSGQDGGLAFVQLPATARMLNQSRGRLDRSPGHRLLLHLSWHQPRMDGRRARAVRLREPRANLLPGDPTDSPFESTVNPEPESTGVERLDGLVRVRASTYLFIDVDAQFPTDYGVAEIRETRRAKLNETHYFDHPLGGALVRVSPYLPAAGQDPLPE